MTGYLALTLNLAGLVLLSEKIAIGWLVGIAAEVCWLIAAKEVELHSLMLMSVIYIVIAVRSFVKWGAE
ncbi:MAG: hypothetical protein V4628_11620 [Pseudomonadota bacterium]